MKLILIIGVRGNYEMTNEAASELNDDAYEAQTGYADAITRG
jgi:hypothetical protein